MSFLEQLQQKRKQLQATATIVTTPTGERFIENRSQSNDIQKLKKQSYGFVIDTKPDEIPACIIDDFLYLGSQDAVIVQNVSAYKLTHILSVGIDSPPIVVTESSGNIQTGHIACLDLPETDLYAGIVQAAIDFIEIARSQNGRVLVHCNAGVSRSASIVIAYLMDKRDMSFETAYKLVKSKRECIQPNVGFMRQLRNHR